MKKWIAAMALAALPLIAQEKKTAPAQKAAPKKEAPAAGRLEIPADAVETEPGTWRHTDAQGKKWIYRKTPFGVGRIEDKGPDKWSEPSKGTASREKKVKVVEEGELVKFELPGPWGPYKWQKKKAELTDEERGWLERSREGSKDRQE